MSVKYRSRLAPSPSSAQKTLHLGNVRTGLISWLVAKQSGGSSILRIENSDTARNVDGCAEGMLDDLNWLGISPTEGYGTNNQPYGPYTQLEKLARYKEMSEYLISKGLAYKCVCTEELLNKQREAAIARNPKQPFSYPGTCRNLKHDPDKNYVIRFKSSKIGETIHNDVVFGRVVYPHKENQDWVLMRHNGCALFNLANVIDDLDNHVDFVVRGRDHMGPNTLQQILLYKAFDANVPKFAHLGMVCNQQKEKLSKRDGAVSVKDMRAMGYSPGAILSYLIRLGWSHPEGKEIFSIDEMIEKFDIARVGRNDACFDPKKFSSIQHSHLKSPSLTSTTEYAFHTMPFIKHIGENTSQEQIEKLVPLIRERAKTFIDAAKELAPILNKNIDIDVEAATKFLTSDNKPRLSQIHSFLSTVEEWNSANLKDKTSSWLAENNLTIKDVGQLLRVSLVGRTQSPELFSVMEFLGKQTTLDRIQRQF